MGYVQLSEWLNKAKENLFNSSVEKNNLQKAITEWSVTENVIDYLEEVESFEDFYASCELCEHPNLRWHFEILNEYTNKSLWVGSKCILKFGIRLLDEYGSEYNHEEKEKKLNSIITRKRKSIKDEKLLSILRKLWNRDTEFRSYIEKSVKFFKKNNSFTPKQILTIDWRLSKHHIKFAKEIFKVRIRNQKERDEIYNLEDWQKEKLIKYLTHDQIEKYMKGMRT